MKDHCNKNDKIIILVQFLIKAIGSYKVESSFDLVTFKRQGKCTFDCMFILYQFILCSGSPKSMHIVSNNLMIILKGRSPIPRISDVVDGDFEQHQPSLYQVHQAKRLQIVLRI
jgi:hypothetical protein